MIDVLITTVLRPQILQRTLAAAQEHCWGDEPVRLVVNVDPVGEATATTEDIAAICLGFAEELLIRKAPEAKYPYSWAWCWTNARGPVVLWLMDDWEITEPCPLALWRGVMQAHDDLGGLRLPFWPAAGENLKQWCQTYTWNGSFFECPEGQRMGFGVAGQPMLLRGDFARTTGPLIDVERNPEKQFHHHNKALKDEVLKWRWGCYGSPGCPAMFRDIGQKWRAEQGLVKTNPSFMTGWVKQEEK